MTIWAVNHSTASATVIDAATGKVTASVTLSGAQSGAAPGTRPTAVPDSFRVLIFELR
jgi:hypothetical protein